MAVITMQEVFRHAEAFERMLADFYGKLAQRTEREGVRLLTSYMSRHRERIADALSKLDEDQIRRIRSVPLHYQPQAADCRCLEGVEIPDDAGAREVVDAAVTFDECLVRLYRQAARQSADDEVRALFEGLIRAEQRDEIELKKIQAMDYF